MVADGATSILGNGEETFMTDWGAWLSFVTLGESGWN
jgi:hypothetical protein